MRVAVTGSEGFLGRAVSSLLIEEGFDVQPIDARLGHYCHVARDMARRLASVDAVVHLGAPSSVTHFRVDAARAHVETVEGMRNVLRYGPERIVTASTCTLYGDSNQALSEESTLPTPPNPYAAAKRACETLCREARSDRRILSLRIFTGYGPGEESKGHFASPVTLFCRSLMRGEPLTIFGSGEQERDFVFVDDVARAIRLSLTADTEYDTFNIASGRSLNFNELLRQIAHHVAPRHQPQVRYVEPPPGYVASIRALTERADRELAFRAKVRFEEGIERTVHHLRRIAE